MGNLRAWGVEAYIKKALKITYQTKLENIAHKLLNINVY